MSKKISKRISIENIKLLSEKQKREIQKSVAESEKLYRERTQDAYLQQAGVELVSDPQRKLYLRLKEVMSCDIEYEKEHLVPGRRFRVDIFIPSSRLAIEFDGFEYHKSKEQFQVDKIKRNALVALGYPVMSFYYAQVENEMDAVVQKIEDAHNLFLDLFNKK